MYACVPYSFFARIYFLVFLLQIICLSLDCKLVLEIIRKLQTRMSSLTIHQISKTKAETICNAITITLYSVRRVRTSITK